MAHPDGMSPTQDRLRRVIGRAGWDNIDSIAYSVIGDGFVQRGLARVVKHRDHTETFELTAAGRAFLAERAPIAPAAPKAQEQ